MLAQVWPGLPLSPAPPLPSAIPSRLHQFEVQGQMNINEIFSSRGILKKALFKTGSHTTVFTLTASDPLLLQCKPYLAIITQELSSNVSVKLWLWTPDGGSTRSLQGPDTFSGTPVHRPPFLPVWKRLLKARCPHLPLIRFPQDSGRLDSDMESSGRCSVSA